jgi:hypothetical protein
VTRRERHPRHRHSLFYIYLHFLGIALARQALYHLSPHPFLLPLFLRWGLTFLPTAGLRPRSS